MRRATSIEREVTRDDNLPSPSAGRPRDHEAGFCLDLACRLTYGVKMRTPIALALIAAAGLATAVTPHAAGALRPPVDTVLDTLERVHAFRSVAISPDGQSIAWVQNLGPAGNAGPSGIWTRQLAGGAARRITASQNGKDFRERSAVWSPDGQWLAFLSDAADGRQMQLYIAPGAPTSTGAPRRVTTVNGQLSDPRWSPDGRTIALLIVPDSAQETGALVAHKVDQGDVDEATDEQLIAIADVTSGTLRAISSPTMYVYDYDWSPDGKTFVAEAVEGSGTNNYWIAQLYTVDAKTGRLATLWKPPLQLACPRWSPDGKSIAVIHGLMSDEGITGGDVYLVPAKGGAARGTAHNLTPGLAGSARALTWQSDGRILVDEFSDGQSAILDLDAATGRSRAMWTAPQQVTSLSIARDSGAAAAIVQSFASASEVYAGPIGAWTRQTDTNTAITPYWGAPHNLHWQRGEFRIQGWLIGPGSLDPAKRYPLVVSVHGGPASANMPSWPARWSAVLPSQDYFVLLPNPRGSYGSGEAFTKANIKDFGYGDFQDLLAGVDAAVAAAPIDRDRVGIIGWSYGGYMAMWAGTQTSRFKAAVAGAGLANWQSYYGQNRIDQWMLPFFGASVDDDPAIYARSSPITFIKRTHTPTLVLHGDRDSEVPTPQGYEYWHALKALGVPTDLVIYPNEGHAFSSAEHWRDVERRVVAWFDRYLVPVAKD